MNEFFTWELLATYSEALPCHRCVGGIPKTIAARLAAPAAELPHRGRILLAAQLFTGGLTLSDGVLSLLNAVLVSLAAGGGYELCRSAVARG